MKHFDPVPAPPEWETKGLAAGRAWLDQDSRHPHEERPRDLWSPYREHLAAGFADLCNYTVMWMPNGTVDHFVPWSRLRGTDDAWRAYDWHNFRFSVGWFNSGRRGAIPDPYLVDDSWFVLQLPSLELDATDDVPEAQRAAVDNVLRWLRKDRRVMKVRQRWFGLYTAGKLTFDGLAEVAPLIAAALRRQPEFMLPRDREHARTDVG
jgi:hypothetical protein